jgi:hypothetical protein
VSSDEPREHAKYCSFMNIDNALCDCHLCYNDEPREDYAAISWLLPRAYAPTVEAVLAEVARQTKNNPDLGYGWTTYEEAIEDAAFAIREAMRLSTEGA